MKVSEIIKITVQTIIVLDDKNKRRRSQFEKICYFAKKLVNKKHFKKIRYNLTSSINRCDLCLKRCSFLFYF